MQSDLSEIVSVVRKAREISSNTFSETLSIKNNSLIIFFLFYGIFLIFALIFYIIWKRYQKGKSRTIPRSSSPFLSSEAELVDETAEFVEYKNVEGYLLSVPILERIKNLNYNLNFEIAPENLQFLEVLGHGHFGVAHKGLLRMANPRNEEDRRKVLTVAIKSSLNRHDPLQEKMVFDELKVMCAIGIHPNVLALIGGITVKENSSRNHIILEYVERGNLLDFIRNKRFIDQLVPVENENAPSHSSGRKTYLFNGNGSQINEDLHILQTSDLLSFAYQIANGMEYLMKIRLVHRDLALRNILIKGNKIIKIADFGLARRHKRKEYYRTTENSEIPLPVLWMAPECFNNHKFNQASDIWSFGVCLYEIFSLGLDPYQEVDTDLLQYLKNGNRLKEPNYSHSSINDLMKLCWNYDPIIRPLFSQCVEFLKEHLTEHASHLLENIERKLEEDMERLKSLKKWIQKENDDNADRDAELPE